MIIATSRYRGHPIEYFNDQWVYSDTKELVSKNKSRTCGKCGIESKDDIDPCLGKLPGVNNACCGHGIPDEAYIQFSNGVIIKGFTEIKTNGSNSS